MIWYVFIHLPNSYAEAVTLKCNSSFEMYSGTSSKLIVTTLLDNVVTNNKKNSDKIITVIYNETTTTAPNEIVELKKSFEQGKTTFEQEKCHLNK